MERYTRETMTNRIAALLGTAEKPLLPVLITPSGEFGWYLTLDIKFKKDSVTIPRHCGTLCIIPRADNIVFRLAHSSDNERLVDGFAIYDLSAIHPYTTIQSVDKITTIEWNPTSIFYNATISYIMIISTANEVIGTYPFAYTSPYNDSRSSNP